jgi:hypothetical protein
MQSVVFAGQYGIRYINIGGYSLLPGLQEPFQLQKFRHYRHESSKFVLELAYCVVICAL